MRKVALSEEEQALMLRRKMIERQLKKEDLEVEVE
jgi:hypothetical protein